MDNEEKPSENYVASEDSKCSQTSRTTEVPDWAGVAQPSPGASGHELNQYAATLAGAVVKEAIETLTRVMRHGGRNSGFQLQAAQELLRLAGEREGTQLGSHAQPSPTQGLRDDLAKRRERLRELRKQQRREG